MPINPQKNAKALMLLAHPNLNQSRANRRIVDHLSTLPDLSVTIHNLYDHYPHFDIDVVFEQNLLRQHELIIFQHPFYWYNMPPLLKLWMDDVLQIGFAYGKNGTALAGKSTMVSITTGGPREAYQSGGRNQFPIETFLTPYIQTAALCGMTWRDPLVLFDANNATPELIHTHSLQIESQIRDCLSPASTPHDSQERSST